MAEREDIVPSLEAVAEEEVLPLVAVGLSLVGQAEARVDSLAERGVITALGAAVRLVVVPLGLAGVMGVVMLAEVAHTIPQVATA